MPRKLPTKPVTEKSQRRKLTDAERHEAFKKMAEEVGASEDPKDFDNPRLRFQITAFVEIALNAEQQPYCPGGLGRLLLFDVGITVGIQPTMAKNISTFN